MHTRRLLCSILGMWLAANLFISVAGSTNLWMVDTTLASSDEPVNKAMKTWGYEPIRQMLRHEAGEANRFLFMAWGWMQLALALIVLGMILTLKSGPVQLASAGLALLMSLAMHFLLTPQIAGLGRMLDFVKGNTLAAEHSRLANMHGIYVFCQALVMMLSAGLLINFLRRTRSRRLSARPINQINTVYDTDNAHIDR